MENMIVITKDEYRELLECAARIKAFRAYIHTEKYSIGKKACGALLGFEVADDDE